MWGFLITPSADNMNKNGIINLISFLGERVFYIPMSNDP